MQIVELNENKEAVIQRILDALPEWFGIESARKCYVHSSRNLPMFTCIADEKAVGCLTLKVHNPYTAEIHSMAVLPEWHRQGCGTKLVHQAERYSKEKGLRFLTVKTLSPSKESDHYRRTRLFYRAVGFLPLEELPTLWGSNNPCLIMIKCIDETPPQISS